MPSSDNRELKQVGSVAWTRPLRIGLLSNPSSLRNRRGLGAIRRILVRNPQVCHREVQTPTEVAEALSEFAGSGLDVVAINGGDGTVQAALTALFHRRAFHHLPLIALLRGGTTNMIAGDVGLKGCQTKALGKLLALASKVHPQVGVLERPVLRVQAAPDQDPLFGMFFGMGAIIKGIEHCHRRIHSKGLRDGLAPGLTTLRVLMGMARGNQQYVAPVSVKVELDPQERMASEAMQPQDLLFLLTSTLERLFLGLRPYWGGGAGPLYCTAVRARPAHVLRALPPLFWGHPNRCGTPENGYSSFKVNALQLTMDSRFTLDGELYQAESRAGPVSITWGGSASFIRL